MNSFQPPIPLAQPAPMPQTPDPAPQNSYAAPEQDPLQQVNAQGNFPGIRLPVPEHHQGENPMAPYLTLGSSVEERVKTKIWQRHYIKLTCLAYINPQVSLLLNFNGLQPTISMSPPESAPITSYWEWLTLFRTYASIYLEVHTHEGAALFTYTERVGEMYRNFPRTFIWLEYDRKFWLQKSVDRNLPWQKVELQILWPMIGMKQQELTTQSSNADKNRDSRNNQPFGRASGGDPPAETCTSYYYKGFCKKQYKGCNFNHLCGHCRKPGHPLTKCRQGQNHHEGNKPGSNSSQKQ